MRCQNCGLPDPYAGAGDGIGSCECARCDCCAAGPLECDCEKDWEDYGQFDDEPDGEDYLCNDRGCVWRQHRIAGRASTNEGASQ